MKQDLVKQLEEMGFSKHASEKALFMTQATGQTLEGAMDWLGQHSEDPDFNEQLFIVKTEGQGNLQKEYQGNLSVQERVALAEAKIKAARERRKVEDEKNAREAEAARRRGDKELAAAKRIAKEREQEVAFAQQKKEKAEFLAAKRKMQIQLERDKCERLGVPFDETKFLQQEKEKSKGSPMDQIKHGVKTVMTLYTEDRQPGVAKTCFKTCSVYAGNALKDVNDPKYQSINLANEAF